MVATLLVVFAWFAVGAPASPARTTVDHFDGLTGITGTISQDPPPTPQEKQKPKPVPVSGRVKDGEARPVAKARITIKGPDRFEHPTWTNEDGMFEFSGLDGDYKITVRAGDKERTFDASIRDGQLRPREFTFE